MIIREKKQHEVSVKLQGKKNQETRQDSKN